MKPGNVGLAHEVLDVGGPWSGPFRSYAAIKSSSSKVPPPWRERINARNSGDLVLPHQPLDGQGDEIALVDQDVGMIPGCHRVEPGVNDNWALKSSSSIGKYSYQLKLKVALPRSRCITRSGNGAPDSKPSCSQ